jgi:arabinofuranan 3-O-arabinosyltransferase
MRTRSDPPEIRLELLRSRVRTILWCGLVAVLPWLWRPGLVAPDTKLDLLTDPWGYLARATVAWDERAGFGQLQNQAHGYLFPMGPFFGIGDTLGLPDWAVQRAWWSLLLVVAFVGAERALRVLGVPRGAATVVPALAYAFSPRVLTVLSDISVEAWPAAICPWFVVVLAPALSPDADRQTRLRMAAGTGLLVTATGGVNAAASLLVLLVPLVLLVTTPAGVARTRTGAWWLLGIVLGAVWWLVPLVVLGFYAFPFLEFIETAAVTTSVTSLPQVFRGTSHWLAYLAGPDGRVSWQAGSTLVQHPLAVVATSLLAALGVAGLLRGPRTVDRAGRRAPLDAAHVHRFAVLSLLLGLVLMSAGYAGTYGGAAAPVVQDLLDGPLAAFRNVHKADPLVRFPLAVGLGWVLGTAPGRIARWTWPDLGDRARSGAWRRSVTGLVAVTLAATLLPVWSGRLVALGSYDHVPGYWSATARYVDEAARSSGGSTLLLPASRSAVYAWGRTDDEPLAALASSPVVVRDAVMLGAPEVSRVLDAADLLASSGARQDGLAAALARMGVARVVVRHDLDWTVLAEDPGLVERTLERSPGFVRVEHLGPESGGVSVWEVQEPDGPVDAYPADELVRVAGGPEALLWLAERGGRREGRALVVGDDPLPAGGVALAQVSTDTLKVRRLNTGRVIRDAYSETLDARAARNRGADLPPAGDGAPETVRVWTGAKSVRVSDEASDPFVLGYRSPQNGAFAAVDGDLETAWLSSSGADSARLEIAFDGEVPHGPLELDVATGADVAELDKVRVQAGDLDVERSVGSGPLVVPLEGATGSRLRITVVRAEDAPRGLPLGLAAVDLGDADVHTNLQAAQYRPDLDRAPLPAGYLLVRDPRDRMEPARPGEDGSTLERIVSGVAAQRVTAQVRVSARAGEQLEELLDEPWRITGSSRVAAGPSGRPGAALDGLRETRWRTEVSNLEPTLTLRADSTQTIRSLRLTGGDRDRIGSVVVRAGDREVELGSRGGRFPALRAREVTIRFRLRDSTGEFTSPEVTLGTARAPERVTLPCGAAGSLEVGGRIVPLSVSTTRADLLAGGPLDAEVCDESGLLLPSGASVVRVNPGGVVRGQEVLLTPEAQPAGSRAAPAPVVRDWGANRRVFDVEDVAGGQVVAFTEGFNPGWHATIDGVELESVRVDGWRQGFAVPAGTSGRVEAEFVPGRWYAAGLVVGGVLVLGLVLLLGWLRLRAPARPVTDAASTSPGTSVVPTRWAGSTWLRSAAVVALLLLLGGGAGLVAAVVVGALLLRVRRSVVVGAWLLGAGGLVVVGARWADRSSVGADVAQLLALGTVAALAWQLVLPGRDHPSLDEEPAE